jgi:hypothetical protein
MRHAPILIALAAATTARAEGDRTLHVVVHGSVDSAVLGESIAKELGIDVVVVDGTCDVPCLDVSVDGKRLATVVYAPRSGSTRSRTVKLGTSTSQWPLVITLLAGNVVRDEARAVLADLPARDLPPPPAAPGVPEPVDEPPADEVPAGPPASGCPAPAPPGERPAEPAGQGSAGESPDDEGPTGEGPTGEGPTSAGPAGGPPGPCPPATAPDPGPVLLLQAPPPSAAVVEPEVAREHRFLGFGLVPGISTDLTHIGSVRHFLSINLLVGVGGGSSGLSLSGIADVERGLVAGFQVGGIAATALRVAGTQVAGVAAVAGDVDGVQIAGTAAIAEQMEGVQAAGVAAIARRSAGTQFAGVSAFAGRDAGLQGSGVAAVARGNAGFQVAGVSAFAGHDANVQAAGVSSVARGTANIQLAGVVNVAHRLRGLQIAPINVAGDVDGVQIGVINYGGSADGFSFGLINIVPGGRYDVEAAVDSDRIGTVLFRHGGRRWHNVYGVGGHRVNDTGTNDDVWMYGLGFGPSLEFGNTVIDLEAIGWQVNHGPRHESDVSILGQLRLSIAQHWGPFALVAGGILNTYVTSDPQSPLFLERRTDGAPMTGSVTVTTWPSAFIGLRI